MITAASYSFAFSHLDDDPFATCIWRNVAPSRCRSFLWQVHQQKLNTHLRLHSRRANNSGLCHFCGSPEDTTHLFLHCPRSQAFWATLHIPSSSISNIELLWNFPFPGPELPNQKARSTIITCLLWNLWKCRNSKVFNQVDESDSDIKRRCAADLLLWANRTTSVAIKSCLGLWSSFILNM